MMQDLPRHVHALLPRARAGPGPNIKPRLLSASCIVSIYHPQASRMSEYITLVNCTAKLVIALRSDTSILHYLNREGFVKPNIYEDVNNPKSTLSASEKAGLLVTGIKDKVELNPKNYHKLMRHFHQDRRLYGDIADILDEEYRKQGGVPKEDHPPAEGTSSHLTCKRDK